MNALLLVSVALGGAVGATARFIISYAVAQRVGSLFPWGTLTVNVTGCFLLGLFVEVSQVVSIGPNARALISVGVIGALTTFSTFALETITLLRAREWQPALLNIAMSVVFGLAACVLGIIVARTGVRLLGRR